jgi:hypothetical protein
MVDGLSLRLEPSETRSRQSGIAKTSRRPGLKIITATGPALYPTGCLSAPSSPPPPRIDRSRRGEGGDGCYSRWPMPAALSSSRMGPGL